MRDRDEFTGVRAFSAEMAEELREHFRGHRDRAVRLHGDFMDATEAPLDVFEASDVEELERLAIQAMSFDGACDDLAAIFLGDYPKASDYDRARLARHVQVEVESWLEQEMKKS